MIKKYHVWLVSMTLYLNPKFKIKLVDLTNKVKQEPYTFSFFKCQQTVTLITLMAFFQVKRSGLKKSNQWFRSYTWSCRKKGEKPFCQTTLYFQRYIRVTLFKILSKISKPVPVECITFMLVILICLRNEHSKSVVTGLVHHGYRLWGKNNLFCSILQVLKFNSFWDIILLLVLHMTVEIIS